MRQRGLLAGVRSGSSGRRGPGGPPFDGIQYAFEELEKEYSDAQLEVVIDCPRRATQRARQETAELTGAVAEAPAGSPAGSAM
jgi:hypothetical protein